MIALLSKSEQILPASVKNLAIALLLLAFGTNLEVYGTNEDSGSDYYSLISHTAESSDFPLSTPFSTEEEATGMENDFWQEDEAFIKLSITSVLQSKSISFHYQNNFLPQEFLKCPFTPPEILQS